MNTMRRIKLNMNHWLSDAPASAARVDPSASATHPTQDSPRPDPRFPNIAQSRKRRLLRRMLIEGLR